MVSFGFQESGVEAMSVSADERRRVFQENWNKGNGFRFMFGTFCDIATNRSRTRPHARSDAPDSRESQLIGAPVGDARELAHRASPVTYVHPGAPPFHIAHGDADRFVPAAQSRQLAEALRGAGVSVEFTEVAGADHLWMNAPAPESIFDAAVRFAQRVTAR